MNIYEEFLKMKEIPRGIWIDNPHDLILTDFEISPNTANVLHIRKSPVSFTRLSLKHLSEKGNAGEYILGHIQEILHSPDSIYLGNFSHRFLISKMIEFQSGLKDHVVSLEVTENMGNIIVTGFISKQAYFKNLKLL